MKNATHRLSTITFVAALALRIIAMPLFFHFDILFIQSYPHYFWTEGIWDIYSTWGNFSLEHLGYTYYPPLLYYIIAAAQIPVLLITPVFSEVLNYHHGIFILKSTIHAEDILSHFNMGTRLIFTLSSKWVYLAADMLCFFVGAHLFSKQSIQRLKFQHYWLWNPVLIFSTFIFGQYRILSCVFIFLMLYYFRKQKLVLGFLFLGLGALMENFPWLLILPLLLVFSADKPSSLARCLGAFLAPLLLILVPLILSSQGRVLYSYASPLIFKVASRNILNSGGVWMAPLLKITAIAGYCILLRCLWCLRSIYQGNSEKIFLLAIDTTFCVLLLLYATTPVSIHYFMWILPFWIYRHVMGVPWSSKLSAVTIFCLFFFNMDRRELNLGLLMPIDPKYWMSVPSLHEIMTPLIAWGKLIGGARVSFSICCFYFVYSIFKIYVRENPKLLSVLSLKSMRFMPR